MFLPTKVTIHRVSPTDLEIIWKSEHRHVSGLYAEIRGKDSESVLISVS